MPHKITIRDVAAAAGTSISSVSRYLADPASVNPASAVSIGKAIAELDYVPNPFARRIRSEFTNTIAVIVPDISDHFFSEACKAICTLCYRHNYSVIVCDTDNDPVKERAYVDDMLRDRAAGIMLAPCGKNTEYLKGVIAKYPRLMLFDRLEPGLDTNVVTEDNVHTGYILAGHMLKKGHRRFAILSGSEYSVNMCYRLQGIRKAFAEYGVEPEERFSPVNLISRTDAANALERLIADPDCPGCILACNTIILDGVVLAASRMKLAVPGDYSIAGLSVSDPRHAFPFPVSAVVQMPAELGFQAGELMINLLTDNSKQHVSKTILLRTHVVD